MDCRIGANLVSEMIILNILGVLKALYLRHTVAKKGEITNVLYLAQTPFGTFFRHRFWDGWKYPHKNRNYPRRTRLVTQPNINTRSGSQYMLLAICTVLSVVEVGTIAVSL